MCVCVCVAWACAPSSNTTLTCHWLLQNVMGFECWFNCNPSVEVNVQSFYRLNDRFGEMKLSVA
jgi:hypothetical protein